MIQNSSRRNVHATHALLFIIVGYSYLLATTTQSFVISQSSRSIRRSVQHRSPPPRRRHRGIPENINGSSLPVVPDDNARNSDLNSSMPPKNNRQRTSFKERPKKALSRKQNNNNNNQKRNHRQDRQRTGGGASSYEFSSFNNQIVRQETALDLLNLLASKKGALSSIAGGGTLSTVNFSTSVHRIARHLTGYQSRNENGNNRARVLSDPRFALLICSTAEAVLDGAEIVGKGGAKKPFGARELSNIAWAIAKLNIAPPHSVIDVNIDEAEDLMREKSQQLRSMIFEIAKQRTSGMSSTSTSPSSWIPVLSELCGLLIDGVCAKALHLDPRFFQQQELSNLMWSLATVQRPNERVFEYVVNSIILSAASDSDRRDQALVPQEWSIPLWCLAKTGITAGHEEELLPFVSDLMENEPGFLERFKPQELSNSAWAAATILSRRPQEAKGPASDAALGILRHVGSELIRRQGEGYSSQELANTGWAMATLGFGISAEQSNKDCHLTHSYTYLPSDNPDGDRTLMEQCLAVIMRKMKENPRQFTAQELNNMCWVMARLDEKDEELLEMIGLELANPRRKLAAQDLSTTLWSMATLEYFNTDLYRSIVARFPSIGARRFKPQEISNTLWALATAGVTPRYRFAFDRKLLPDTLLPAEQEILNDPVTAFFMAGGQELIARPDEFKTQEIKDVLWSFARVGLRHPFLFRTVAEYLVGKGDEPKVTGRGLEEFNAQGIANLAYAFARHAQLGAETLEKYGRKCRLPATGGRLAVYVVSFLDVGEGLQRKLFAEIARVDLLVHDKLRRMSTQDMSNTAWAFAILGLKHDRFLAATSDLIKSRMMNCIAGNSASQLRGQELTNTIWALATLNYKPSGLLDIVEAYLMKVLEEDTSVAKVSRFFSTQELSNLAWSVAVFGDYPENLIKLLYIGILGTGDRPGPSQVRGGFRDNVIDPTQINSILYLQTMMDLEWGKGANGFALPNDFPEAWTNTPGFPSSIEIPSSSQLSQSSSPSDSHMMNGGLRELNTSKIQVQVSKAFDRIGFDHVDEFVCTMEDMVQQYGINMASYEYELLSLDIANVESKIGIEVDGPGHYITKIDSGDDDNYSNILSNIGYHRMNSNGVFEYKFNWNYHEQEPNGSTSLKSRMFKKLGWRVVNLPFWEWTNLESKEIEEEYCRSLLQTVE